MHTVRRSADVEAADAAVLDERGDVVLEPHVIARGAHIETPAPGALATRGDATQ